MKVSAFIAKWTDSGAAERANKDHFLLDLCDVLAVERPKPTAGDPEKDVYTFERDAVLLHEGQKTSVGRMDLYKESHFILEAKQGSDEGAAKKGTAKRGTAAWNLAMHDA
ncbi:MAG TPA: type IIL restriction-modification enzyme MmeI, partial [Thermoanaerobaculia bacterium]